MHPNDKMTFLTPFSGRSYRVRAPACMCSDLERASFLSFCHSGPPPGRRTSSNGTAHHEAVAYAPPPIGGCPMDLPALYGISLPPCRLT